MKKLSISSEVSPVEGGFIAVITIDGHRMEDDEVFTLKREADLKRAKLVTMAEGQ